MLFCCDVYFFFEEFFVCWVDGVFLSAEHLCAYLLSLPERELRHRAADAALDALGPERDLVVALAFAPLLRAVGVADRHPDDRDRGVHAAERDHPGNAPPGAHDHTAADLLA